MQTMKDEGQVRWIDSTHDATLRQERDVTANQPTDKYHIMGNALTC